MTPLARIHLVLLLTLPLAAVAEPARVLPPEPVGTAGAVQVVLALGAVLAAFFVLAWLLRRIGSMHGSGSGALRVLAGLPVGQRERVVLVQVGERQLLLGVAPGRVTTLHVLEENIDFGRPGGEGFAERLGAAIKRGGKAS